MKDILRSLAKIDAIVVALFALSGWCAGSAKAKDMAFEFLDERDKKLVAADIMATGDDVGFAVAYESGRGYKWYKDETSLPLASSFGLAQANIIISSMSNEIRMTNGLVRCYIYESGEHLRRGHVDQSCDDYHGEPVFNDCVCRFALVKLQKTPMRSRFRPFRARSKLASPDLVDWDSVWDYEIRPGVKVFDKQQFLSVFSNNVYKVSGGMFAVDMGVAKKIVTHDFRRGCSAPAEGHCVATTPRLGNIAILNGREISEVVYWLWNRKGKVDEYANFVKSHPELFEPIADVSEFKTELGKRLLGTWK